MTLEEIDKIIENHKHWLNEDCDGWENMRADLCGADLRGANLRHVNLSDADLRRADLSYANLRHANLSDADLCDAYLSDADLRHANLRDANLRHVDLRHANLSGANLRRADLCNANLRRADLSCANLRDADLRRADLSCANLSGAEYSECTSFFALQCPEEGSYIAWKKCKGFIVKLEIPSDAKRSSATTRKCRASKAVVLEIQNLDGSKSDVMKVSSNYDAAFVYEVGKTIEVNDFNDDRWIECTSGIHHFITRREAVHY